MAPGNQRHVDIANESREANGKLLALYNVLAFVVNCSVVGLSQTGLLGKTNKTIADEYPTLVTPQALFFGIWGIVYQLEAAFVIYQALPNNWGKEHIVKGIGHWFIWANLAQALWSVLFAREAFIVSSFALAGIAFSLAQASIGLSQYRTGGQKVSWVQNLTLHWPIGIHAGWTAIAAFLNVNVALKAADATVRTQVGAALISLAVAFGLALRFALTYKDDAFLAGIAWGLIGIRATSSYRKDILHPTDVANYELAVTSSALILISVDIYRLVNRAKGTAAIKKAR